MIISTDEEKIEFINPLTKESGRLLNSLIEQNNKIIEQNAMVIKMICSPLLSIPSNMQGDIN